MEKKSKDTENIKQEEEETKKHDLPDIEETNVQLEDFTLDRDEIHVKPVLNKANLHRDSDGAASVEQAFDISSVSEENIWDLMYQQGCFYGRFLEEERISLSTLSPFAEDLTIKLPKMCIQFPLQSFIDYKEEFSFMGHTAGKEGIYENEMRAKVPFVIDASTKAQFGIANQQTTQKEIMWVSGYNNFAYLSVNLQQLVAGKTNEEFRNFFNNKTVTKNTVKDFFEIYGHIYPQRVTFGGKLYSFERQTFTESNDITAAKFQFGVAAKGRIEELIDIGGSAKTGVSFTSKDKASLQSGQLQVQAIGGNPQYLKEPSKWRQSLLGGPKMWALIGINSIGAVHKLLADERIVSEIEAVLSDDEQKKTQSATDRNPDIYPRTEEQRIQHGLMLQAYKDIQAHNKENSARSICCLFQNLSKHTFTFVDVQNLHGSSTRFKDKLGYDHPMIMSPGDTYVFETASYQGFFTGCWTKWQYKSETGKILLIDFEKSYLGYRGAKFSFQGQEYSISSDEYSDNDHYSGKLNFFQ